MKNKLIFLRNWFIAASILAIILTGCGKGDERTPAKETSTTETVEKNVEEAEIVDSNALKPLEIKDTGYVVTGGDGEYYLQIAMILHNPNDGWYCDGPNVRITAEDKDGNVLDTDEQSIFYLNGNRTTGFACQVCSMTEKPAKVSFDVINTTDDFTKGTSGDLGISATNVKITKADFDSKVAGKIHNSTNNMYPSVAATVIFRDKDGKITGGETGYIDNVAANGDTPFSIDCFDDSYFTDYCEIYFNNWDVDKYDTVIEDTDMTIVEGSNTPEKKKNSQEEKETTEEATTEKKAEATTEKKKEEEPTTEKKKEAEATTEKKKDKEKKEKKDKVITKKNNEDFKKLVELKDNSDPFVEKFCEKYNGETVEFKGCVAWLQPHENYKTRYDVLLYPCDYDAEDPDGAQFAFVDENYSDMNVVDADEVRAGMNFKIKGKILGYNKEGNFIQLDPVRMKAR